MRRFADALTAGRIEDALACVDPGATAWVAGGTPLSGSYGGPRFRDALVGAGRGYRRPSFRAPLQLTWTGWTAERERVAVEAESLGTLEDGRTYNNRYHFLFVVRDGAIVELRIYLDTQHAVDVFCTDDLRR